jgi:RNA-directed DNA polymerase
LLEQNVKPAVEAFLSARGLQLAPEKTLITHISKGFDFLGQNVRKYGNKLLIKPARKSQQAILNKVADVLKSNRTATQAQVIMVLNPILRGWAMYHRTCRGGGYLLPDRSSDMGRGVGPRRRHPEQERMRWIKARYFERHGRARLGLRMLKVPGRELAYRPSSLFRPTRLPIKRHTKVRSNANPFDPAWSAYFQRRAHAI